MFFCLDPSAADLVALFLYQADVASSIARDIVGKENVSINGTQAESSVQHDGSSLRILVCCWNAVYSSDSFFEFS